MGACEMRQVAGLAKADEKQRHYGRVINPNPRPDALALIFKRRLFFTGVRYRLDRSERRTERFRTRFARDLDHAGWVAR